MVEAQCDAMRCDAEANFLGNEIVIMRWENGRGTLSSVAQCNATHHDETDHGDDGHENARTFAQRERVELYEWLRGIEREEGVQVRNAEQEEDGGEESKHAGCDCARDDSFTGNDTVVFKLALDHNEALGNAKPTWHVSSLRQCGPRRRSRSECLRRRGLGSTHIRFLTIKEMRIYRKQLTMTKANSIPEGRQFRCLSFVTTSE
jgi:hypothetical protein